MRGLSCVYVFFMGVRSSGYVPENNIQPSAWYFCIYPLKNIILLFVK